MSLLTDVVSTALEPGYREAATDRAATIPKWRGRTLLAIALVVAGALFGTAAMQTTQQAPVVQAERDTLIRQITAARQQNVQLSGQLQALQAEVARLQSEQLGADSSVGAEVERMGVITGGAAVQGPGMVVVVDDAETLSGQSNPQAIVVDTDLRRLVNALWSTGAEAIAINGHRVSSRTAIRGAGSAITVDYVSLNRPYRLEVIGDPKVMPARLNSSGGGELWNLLKQNFGMRYDVSTSKQLSLPADPGLGLRTAKAGR